MTPAMPALHPPRARALTVMNVVLPFVIGLSVRTLSSSAIVLLFLVNLPHAFRNMRTTPGDVARFLILASFLLSYFFTASFWGFVPQGVAITQSLLVLAGYACGLMMGSFYRHQDSRGITGPVLGFAAGFTLVAFLSVRAFLANSNSILIIERQVPIFWQNDETVNGPVLGIFASLSMCMLPVVLLGADGDRNRHTFLRVILAALVATGLYVNVALQNRSPYVATAASIILCSAYFYTHSDRGPAKKVGRLLLRLSPFAVLIAVVLVFSPDILTNLFFVRFGEYGMVTGRTDAWALMTGNLFAYPVGGKQLDLAGLNYVHNLWLDVAYTTGLLPFVLILLFHALHIPSVIRFFRNFTGMFSGLVLLAISVSMFTAFMGEPVLDASALFFTATCTLLGLIRGASPAVRVR